MKTLDAAFSGGKEIPVSRNETCIFPPSIRRIDDSMVRWLGMDVIGVKIEQSVIARRLMKEDLEKDFLG